MGVMHDLWEDRHDGDGGMVCLGIVVIFAPLWAPIMGICWVFGWAVSSLIEALIIPDSERGE